MSKRRWTWNGVLVQVVVLSLLALGWGTFTAAGPQDEGSQSPTKGFQIKVDRSQGLVPLRVEISGVLLDSQQHPVGLEAEQRIVLEIETAHILVSSGGGSRSFISAGVAELDSSGIEDPLFRRLEIHKAGTYTFQLVLTDTDGSEIRSNKVQVKAM